jgi:hypothetical protein
MINITDINKDDMITLEEANEILAYAKRIYPGQLSGITIKEGRPFAFYHEPGKKWYITIPVYIDDMEEFDKVSENIINHINKEFNSNIAHTMKAKSINALCHEIGHAVDRANSLVCNPYYDDILDEQYDDFYSYANKMYNYLYEIEPDIWMEEGDFDTEEEWQEHQKYCDEYNKEYQETMEELDHEYRLIPAEYTADKFSVDFMNTHLRHISELFEDSDDNE